MRPEASHGEIEGGTKFWRREFCVEKQERMREREREEGGPVNGY
jgi:hypothetical protein